MRVLLDENLPHDLIDTLIGHSVLTVQGLGWHGTKNGALLKRASGLIDAFVTIDGNLQYQQSVSILPFGIVGRRSPVQSHARSGATHSGNARSARQGSAGHR